MVFSLPQVVAVADMGWAKGCKGVRKLERTLVMEERRVGLGRDSTFKAAGPVNHTDINLGLR